MTSIQPHASGPARQPALAPRDLDSKLSSTTPDVAARSRMLPVAGTLGTSAAVGIGLGALALRSRGAGWGLSALAAGGARGIALGAGIGAALLVLDRLTDGQVKRQLDYVALDRRNQIWFVLSNPTKPWLARTGLRTAEDARRAQHELFGDQEPLDGPQDAFRHAYAAALLTLRAIRDHGQDPAEARRLAIGAGEAHEADGQDNNDEWSRSMDHANNETGAAITGDGRAGSGEQGDAAGFLTEAALRERVLAALAGGRLQVVDRPATGAPVPRPTTAEDLPKIR